MSPLKQEFTTDFCNKNRAINWNKFEKEKFKQNKNSFIGKGKDK